MRNMPLFIHTKTYVTHDVTTVKNQINASNFYTIFCCASFYLYNKPHSMKLVLIAGGLLLQFSLVAQNVGIGTTLPLSRLHVEQGNVLFIGPSVLPSVADPLPVSGAGSRLIWYPEKGAFRAGFVNNKQWDSDSIGKYSIAAGVNCKATGFGAVAMGYAAVAAGYAATSFGFD
jgi:hypothetical protein